MLKSDKKKAYEHSLTQARQGILLPVLTCARVTRDCNIACYYCSEIYIKSGQDLEYGRWKQVSDITYYLGNRDFVITGGEPLVKDYIPDLVSYIASRDTYVSLATNGFLLQPGTLQQLNDSGLDFLCISIDSLPGEGALKFGKTLNNKMKRILELIGRNSYNFETQISTVVTNQNLSQLPKMIDYFSSLGISTKLMIMMVNNINHEKTEQLSLLDKDKEIESVVLQLQEMKSKGALLIDDDFTLDRFRRFSEGRFTYNCNGGAYDLSINNDGRLVICPDGIISETSIFGLKSLGDYQRFIEENKEITDVCNGCLWSHKQRLEEVITHK